MEYKVTSKQTVGKHCVVCGIENPLSLKTEFYELEDGRIAALFTPRDEHQSYPGRMHGGMISAILDETMGRAIMVAEPNTWAVTADMEVKFKKPTPLNTPLKCIAKVTHNTRRYFIGEGEIRTEDGTVVATATARFVKMDLEKIASEGNVYEEIIPIDKDTDPKTIDL